MRCIFEIQIDSRAYVFESIGQVADRLFISLLALRRLSTVYTDIIRIIINIIIDLFFEKLNNTRQANSACIISKGCQRSTSLTELITSCWPMTLSDP